MSIVQDILTCVRSHVSYLINHDLEAQRLKYLFSTSFLFDFCLQTNRFFPLCFLNLCWLVRRQESAARKELAKMMPVPGFSKRYRHLTLSREPHDAAPADTQQNTDQNPKDFAGIMRHTQMLANFGWKIDRQVRLG